MFAEYKLRYLDQSLGSAKV